MSEFWKKKIRTYFCVFDNDKDGFITEEEVADRGRLFADAYKTTTETKGNLIKAHTDVLQVIMKSSDAKDNRLTLETFIDSMMRLRYDPELTGAYVHLMRSLFEVIDVNHDGYLQEEEHKLIYKNVGVPEGTFDDKMAFDAMDRNGDGKVSFDEFIAALLDFLFSEDESSPSKFFFGPLID